MTLLSYRLDAIEQLENELLELQLSHNSAKKDLEVYNELKEMLRQVGINVGWRGWQDDLKQRLESGITKDMFRMVEGLAYDTQRLKDMLKVKENS